MGLDAENGDLLIQSVLGNTRWSSMRFLENILRYRQLIRESNCHCRVQNSRALILKWRYPRSLQSKVRRMRMLLAIPIVLPVIVRPVRVVMRGLIAIMTL